MNGSSPDERLTLDHFMRSPYDGLRYEIIDEVQTIPVAGLFGPL